ncbi:MAG: hypothetical protein ACJ75G_11740 [Gaiellaceae bacterium]
MSSTIQESLSHRDNLVGDVEHHQTWREVARTDLAQEIAAQQDRLHALRASMLQQLAGHHRPGVPRWPSGPKFAPTLVDEDEWWAKMLGRKRAA